MRVRPATILGLAAVAAALCSPADGWLKVDGVNELVVWHLAQSVRPPCWLPWQLLQSLPGASRPLLWHFSQAKVACGPPSATGCWKWFAHDEVVWQRRQTKFRCSLPTGSQALTEPVSTR